jgi:hypothetical protein
MARLVWVKVGSVASTLRVYKWYGKSLEAPNPQQVQAAPMEVWMAV